MTKPDDSSWKHLTTQSNEWVSRIIIHENTIYGIGKKGAVHKMGVHGGSWTKITHPNVVDIGSHFSVLNFGSCPI